MDNQKIALDTPIKRGETEITAIELRKPDAGALRGCSLRGILDLQADDLIKLLPRITEPPLTVHEAARLDPADLVQMGAVIAGFLLPKQALAQAEEASGYPLQ